MDGQLVDVWDFEWKIKQLTAEQSELRKYIRAEYDKYETFHTHAAAMRKRFPWLR